MSQYDPVTDYRQAQGDAKNPTNPYPGDVSANINPVKGIREDSHRIEVQADRNWVRRSFHYFNTDRDYGQAQRDYGKNHQAKGLSGAPGVIEAKHRKAWRSFVSTELGGNFPINTLYGYTPTADIAVDRQFPGLGGEMGRAYQERIEDNAHDIHIRLGVQKFNTGISFFSSWFDYYSHSVAVHGRTPSILYEIGQVAGIVMGFMAPQVVAVGFMIKFFALLGGGRFWYVSPAMPLYWTAVTNIFNEITGSMGLTLPTTADDAYDMKFSKGTQGSGPSARNGLSYIQKVSKLLPGVFQEAWGSNEEGFNIDVRRVASRAQSTQMQINQYVSRKLQDARNYDTDKAFSIYDEAMQAIQNLGKWGGKVGFSGSVSNKNSLRAYTQEYFKSKLGSSDTKQNAVGFEISEKNRKDGQSVLDADSMQSLYTNAKTNSNTSDIDTGDDVQNLFMKELNDGSAWVTLRVDGTRSISESFSNTSEESQIASMINGWADSRKQLMFNMAGGSMFGDIMQSVMNGAADFVGGLAKSFKVEGLTGFLFGAKVDIPKTYGSSSASLPKASYTIKLRTPYKHPLCVAQDLYLPLAMILGMGLPLSQGRNAHGGPFYCEVYDRGRCVIKNGIVSSISVERATSNVAWTAEGFPLGIDITIDIENLDTTIHMPINTMGFLDSLNPFDAAERILIGNEGAMADYVSTLASLSLPDMIYRSNNFKRNLYAYQRQWTSYWDRDHFIQRIAASAPGKFVSAFVPGTDRR